MVVIISVMTVTYGDNSFLNNLLLESGELSGQMRCDDGDDIVDDNCGNGNERNGTDNGADDVRP